MGLNIDRRISGCSFDISTYTMENGGSNHTSIMLQNTRGVHISECWFYNHSDSAILLVDVIGNTTIEGSEFKGNLSLLDDEELRSGGVVVKSSYSVSAGSVIQIESCKFISNFNKILSQDWNSYNCQQNCTYGFGGAVDIRIAEVEDSNITVSIAINNCEFTGNQAIRGGAISIRLRGSVYHNIILINSSNFTNNKACLEGGALYLAIEENFADQETIFGNPLISYAQFGIYCSNFLHNHALQGGGVAILAKCTDCGAFEVELLNSTWIYNLAKGSGFAVYLHGSGDQTQGTYNTVAIFGGITKFTSNACVDFVAGRGTIAVDNALVLFKLNSTILESSKGSALVLYNASEAQFFGNVTFTSNVGVLGGAILIEDESHVFFNSSSSVFFIRNTAWILGGAIFSRGTGSRCSLEIGGESAHVFFQNNFANWINQSVVIKNEEACRSTKQILTDEFKYIPSVSTQILFSSDDAEITLEAVPQVKELKVMLGEKFYLRPTNISLKSVGYLRLWTEDGRYSSNTLLRGPSTIGYDDHWNNMDFFIQGPEVHEKVKFYIRFFYEENTAYHVGNTTFSLTVVPCKIGYQYNTEQKECVCASQSSNMKCSNDGRSLCVKRHYWYSSNFNKAFPCPIQNCWYVYDRCPRKAENCYNSTDYCSIQKSDDVCWNGRSGLLCSQCMESHSFTFSAFMCVDSSTCTRGNTALLMLALIVYWMLIIVAMLAVLSLELSIGSGFMYGIVYFFSVSIIYTKSSVLFNDLWLRIILYVDMAITWLDPELIGYAAKLCFAKSWDNPLPHQLFRYATPVFVISTIIAIVLVSRYCNLPRRISFAENSPIHAICMLILLSYTSVACTNFKLLIPLQLNGTLRVQSAPNISYFSKEHVPYAFIAICAEIFLSLPICFLLLFANRISKHVNLVKLRLKPIIDEFQACYRPECCWFAGFYFLARQVIFFVSEISFGTPQSNIILTTANVLIVIIHTSFQPYKNKLLNILDTILLMDIVFLSMLSTDTVVDGHKVNQFLQNKAIPIILILVPTILLYGILLYILYKKMRTMFERRLGRFFNIRKIPNSVNSSRTSLVMNENNSDTGNSRQLMRVEDPYYSDAVLREPLLEDLDINDTKQRRKSYGTNPLHKSKGFTSASLHLPSTN